MSIDSNAAFTNTDNVAFPDNTSVNATGPGTTDGTEFVKVMIDNYCFGPMQAMLNQTGQTPSGSVEIASASQFLEGVIRLVSKGVVFSDAGAADAYVLTQLSGLQAPVAYYDGQEVSFKAAVSNTGASVIDVAAVGSKSITFQDGSALTAGTIVADKYTTLRFSLADNRFEVVDSANITGVLKAWVNFNGTGTVAIRSSLNVSSITDNGVGDYTVNFSTPWADTTYCITGFARDNDDNIGDVTLSAKASATKTVNAMRVHTGNPISTSVDSSEVGVHFTGAQ